MNNSLMNIFREARAWYFSEILSEFYAMIKNSYLQFIPSTALHAFLGLTSFMTGLLQILYILSFICHRIRSSYISIDLER